MNVLSLYHQCLRNTPAIWERVSKWVFNGSLCTADLCKETALISHQPILRLHLETAASTFIHPSRRKPQVCFKHILPPVGRAQNYPCHILRSTDKHNHVAFLNREITDIRDRPVELRTTKTYVSRQEFLLPVTLHSALLTEISSLFSNARVHPSGITSANTFCHMCMIRPKRSAGYDAQKHPRKTKKHCFTPFFLIVLIVTKRIRLYKIIKHVFAF